MALSGRGVDSVGGKLPVQQAAAAAGGLATTASLERVMDGLGESEKYNAVLQGVSSLLMGKKKGGSAANGAFEEVFQLLDEMHANRIKCTIRTASAVVDAATATANIGIITEVFAKIRRAGVGQKFSRDLGRLSLLPTEPSKKRKALQGLAPVPDDDRAEEIGYAASFMLLVGSDFSWEGVGQVMHYDTTIPTVIGAITAAAVAIDVWKRAGCTSKMVLNGMNRLFLKDVERESRAEAGAFLAAYMTGLPCFAFQPSAVEALRMAADPDMAEVFLSGNGVHRILVWLLAGVAGEGLVHRQMIASDPRQAYAFLQMARNRGIGFELDPQDDPERVQWAFNEARALLKDNESAFEALRKRLESGGATVGDSHGAEGNEFGDRLTSSPARLAYSGPSGLTPDTYSEVDNGPDPFFRDLDVNVAQRDGPDFSGKPAKLRTFSIDVYELQSGGIGRRWRRIGWTYKDGSAALGPAVIKLPDDWVWASEWKIDGSGGRDGDGWEYGKDLIKFNTSRVPREKRALDRFRRRRWVRAMQQQQEQHPQESTEIGLQVESLSDTTGMRAPTGIYEFGAQDFRFDLERDDVNLFPAPDMHERRAMSYPAESLQEWVTTAARKIAVPSKEKLQVRRRKESVQRLGVSIGVRYSANFGRQYWLAPYFFLLPGVRILWTLYQSMMTMVLSSLALMQRSDFNALGREHSKEEIQAPWVVALRSWAAAKTSGLGYSLHYSGQRLGGAAYVNFMPFFFPFSFNPSPEERGDAEEPRKLPQDKESNPHALFDAQQPVGEMKRDDGATPQLQACSA
eukprot:g14873.t1